MDAMSGWDVELLKGDVRGVSGRYSVGLNGVSIMRTKTHVQVFKNPSNVPWALGFWIILIVVASWVIVTLERVGYGSSVRYSMMTFFQIVWFVGVFWLTKRRSETARQEIARLMQTEAYFGLKPLTPPIPLAECRLRQVVGMRWRLQWGPKEKGNRNSLKLGVSKRDAIPLGNLFLSSARAS